ncbi:MAG: CoA synthetase, partial [Rhodospirillaceae bacterium]|nr:CoA synthetase [Rhodospirillaceae bacterium]
MSAPYRIEELLVAVICRLLEGCRHIAVGVSSPIPGAAALLRRALDHEAGQRTKVSIIGAESPEFRIEGGVDLFDCAGQGRIDAFFLSGGQIDGGANINLVGVGDYPRQKARWGGSFGSAYLYFTVPRVILFREEHSPRVLVPKVDFVSAPGTSPPGVYRPGGPRALVTPLCLFAFDPVAGGFALQSVHPGVTVEEVRRQTGFAFAEPATVPETAAPDPAWLALLR